MFGFGWMKRLRERRQLRRKIAARAVLEYWDGKQARYGDPFAIWRKLANHPTVDLKAIAPQVDLGQEPESTQYINAVAGAFEVARWDSATGTGLTDYEIINLMALLYMYVSDVKKNSSPGPTLPPATASASSTGPTDPGEVTKPSSDSGSV